MQKKTLLIYSGDQIYSEGIRFFLQTRGGYDDVKVCLINEHKQFELMQADVIVLETSMGLSTCSEVCVKLSVMNPGSGLMLLTSNHSKDFIHTMMNDGVSCFVYKSSTNGTELLKALQCCLSGKIYSSEKIKTAFFRACAEKKSNFLTGREYDVIESLKNGLSTIEIADKLFISKSTVESHKRKLFQKAHVTNSTSLVNWAYQNGIFHSNKK